MLFQTCRTLFVQWNQKGEVTFNAAFCHFWNLTALGHCSLSMYWKELLLVLSVSFCTISYHWWPLYGQKTHFYVQQKNMKSYRFGRTWQWIIYIFGWTISLRTWNTVRNQPLPIQWILSFWALVGLRVLDPPAKPKNGRRQAQRASVQEEEREGQGPAHQILLHSLPSRPTHPDPPP